MPENMTPIERVTAALELREPDRVPVFDVMEEMANVYKILGKRPFPLGPLFRNPYSAKLIDRLGPAINASRIPERVLDDFAYDRTKAAVEFGYDAAWVMHVPIWKFLDSKNAIDIWGRAYDIGFDKEGNMDTPMYREGLIKSPEDWKNWDKRDLLKWPARTNRVFKKIQKDFGCNVFVCPGFLFGLFENTWQTMGFERFSVALRREKEFLKRMIKFFEDHFCMMIEAWADAGVPGLVYTDDQAFRSGPMINPRQMKELYTDPYSRIAETAHKCGMKIIVHSCGRVYDLLEWWADCGFDAVHALEPTAGIEIAKVKEMVGDRMCIIGNIDITHILVDATRDEVYDDVKRHVADAGTGGGYMVAPTNSHPGMTLENLQWMIEATKKYGRYPLEV